MALTLLRTDRVAASAELALPTGLAATSGDGEVDLSWTAPNPSADVTDYSVQYRTSPSGSWTTFDDGVSTATAVVVTGLTNGTVYDFRVAAIRDAVVGDYVGPVTAAPAALPGPTGLQAVPGNGSVALSWTAPSPSTGVTDYANQYRVSPAGAWQTFAHAVSTATSRTITGLANGTTYNFRVAAVRSGDVGDYTAGPATATPVGTPPPTGSIFTEHVGFGTVGLSSPQQIVVTSNANSGPGTLRDAVAGNGHKHITFASSMTITVTSALTPGNNTLIDGRGRTVIIQGTNTTSGINLIDKSNVTVTDLTMRGFGNLALTGSNDPYDAILVENCSNIWLHHLDLSTASDKAIGVQRGSSGVTVSWCRFHDQEQNFLVGNLSGRSVDGNITLTVHHNFFDRTGYRNPQLSYGRAHVYNNYYLDWRQYGTRSQRSAQMMFENNVLFGARNNKATLIDTPGNGCNDNGSLCDDSDGFLVLRNNLTLPGSISLVFRSSGTVFDPAAFYAYTAETASQALADRIVAGAGPRT